MFDLERFTVCGGKSFQAMVDDMDRRCPDKKFKDRPHNFWHPSRCGRFFSMWSLGAEATVTDYVPQTGICPSLSLRLAASWVRAHTRSPDTSDARAHTTHAAAAKAAKAKTTGKERREFVLAPIEDESKSAYVTVPNPLAVPPEDQDELADSDAAEPAHITITADKYWLDAAATGIPQYLRMGALFGLTRVLCSPKGYEAWYRAVQVIANEAARLRRHMAADDGITRGEGGEPVFEPDQDFMVCVPHTRTRV
jgi:hypothetical protein